MIIEFSDPAYAEMLDIGKRGSPRMVKKIRELLDDIENHPRWGIGKPEQLKYYKEETWSRRIDRKNRMVYEISEDDSTVFILSLKGHYEG